MTEFMLVDNDVVTLFAMITAVSALALIIVELVNFIPDLMLNVLNRMRNKTLAHEQETLLSSLEYKNSLDPVNMESSLDKAKSLTESDLFKRFKSQ
jgi:hypothetical protein